MVTLSTRIHISCARTLHFAGLSDDENRYWWGSDWSSQIMGGNLTIEATIKGGDTHRISGIPGDGYTGYPVGDSGHLMNPPAFEVLLKDVCRPLDHRNLNTEVFQGDVSSLERIGLWIYTELEKKLVKPLNIERIRVRDGADQWIDIEGPQKMRKTHVYQIHCVHRHHNPDLSMEENQQLYHKCSAMHGHSYKIEVVVERPLEQGLVIARGEIDKIVNEKLVEPLNGTLLNDYLGNTSGEIIAQQFYEILAPHLKGLVTIAIRETRKNSFFFVPNSFQSTEVWRQI